VVDSGVDAPKAGNRVIREIDRTYLKPPDRGVPPPRSGQPPLEVLTGLEHGSPVIDAGLHQPGWMLGRSDLGNERRRHHGIFEAMARAVPVAASGICAVPEMLDFGKAGFVVQPVSVSGWRTHVARVDAITAVL
jgi:glycosyltransferase involved in cell wall biosynthesis